MRWTIVTAMLAAACGSPEVLEAERFGYDGSPAYKPCKVTTECPSGQTCVQSLCHVGAVAGTDASIAHPDAEPDVTASPVDTAAEKEDVVATADPGTADLAPTPDPGKAPADPGESPPDPGPPPPGDTCTAAGTNNGCETVQEACRVGLESHALECSGSDLTKPFGAPCTKHEDCDLLYGCHFGVCTKYCELAFGSAQCPGGQCLTVGHPVFGACKADPP